MDKYMLELAEIGTIDALPEIEVEEIEVEYLTDSDYEADPADCVVIHWDR